MKAYKQIIIILFSLILLSNLSSPISAALTDGLWAYWSFNETSGNAIDSAYGRVLQQVGTVGYETGKIGNARGAGTFSTVNYFNITRTILASTDDFNHSLNFWVKRNGTIGTEEVLVMFSTGYPSYGLDFRSGGTSYTWMQNAYATHSLTLSNVSWDMYSLVVYKNRTALLYVNGSLYSSGTDANAFSLTTAALQIGRKTTVPAIHLTIDEYGEWNKTLSAAEINLLWAGGSSLPFPFTPPATATNFSVTAIDEWNSTALNITVWINGTNYGTNTTVTTNILSNSTTLHNITIGSTGYFNRTYSNYNVSSNLIGSLYRIYRVFNVTYSNYITYGSSNYTRNLTYRINLTCPSYDAPKIEFYSMGDLINQHNLTCTNSSQIVTGSYQATTEGDKVILFYYNATGDAFNFGATNFIFDLLNPTAVGNFTRNNGFNNFSTNVSSRCYDNFFPNLNYTTKFNTATLLNSNYTNNTVVYNSSILIFGANTLNVTCADPFGATSFIDTETVYTVTMCLIDERENTYFDPQNLSQARVYFDDNSTYFDYKVINVSCVNFTGIGTEKLRFELRYASGDIIARYVDVTLFNNSAVRVCANKEGITHYEQLLISSIEKDVFLKNVFSNCVIAADSTRFAYQSSLVLKAYSINSLYYLYTFDQGNQVLLASLDGSISTYINLDTLEFNQNAYDVSILGDALAFEKTSATQMKIYYKNLANDNANLTATITQHDNTTATTVFSTSSFTNPNNFTMYFDFTTLNITNDTVFKITLTKTSTTGITSTMSKYFNTQAQSGKLPSAVGFVIAFLLVVFGLTFTISRTTFSWFGIAMVLASIGVLTFTMSAWYIKFLVGIDFIIGVYICIVLAYQTYPTVS